MATLETQYKNYLIKNPKSTFTFDEWRKDFGEQLNKSITKMMTTYLQDRGWRSITLNDNWVDTTKTYLQADWNGMTLERAFRYVINNEDLYNVDVVVEKVKVPNIWSITDELIDGEVIQNIREYTMDCVVYEKAIVKTKYGSSSYFRNELK